MFNAKKKEKSREEMTPEERARRDSVDLKCLTLTIATLERVNGVSDSLLISHLLTSHVCIRLWKKTRRWMELSMI